MAEALGLSIQVTEALQQLSDQGLAHLSLKPNNILLDASRQEVILSDFGISQAVQTLPHMPATAVNVQIQCM